MKGLEMPKQNYYKVVSLFSGCGGSSSGYKLAGMNVVLANEFIEEAANTYEANHPGTIMLRDDIRTLTGKGILSKINMNVGELDLLDGSPPCASFSFIGKREKGWGKVKQYSDKKQRVDDLFHEYIRLLDEIKPKVFVAENVAAMAMGKAKEQFDIFLYEMRHRGYKVRCRLLNARFFNVAQNRPRLIFIGVRNDLNFTPTHPLPQYRAITLREALKDVVNTPEEIAQATYSKEGSVYPYLLKMKPGENGKKYSPTKGYYSLVRLRWDAPCNTIMQADAKQTSSQVVHPEEHRRLTISEIKKVSSFPNDFILTGSYQQQWERIGRAVPPNMMKGIAEHVRYFILDKINNCQVNNDMIYGVKREKFFPYYDIKADTQTDLTYDEYCAILESNQFKEYESKLLQEPELF
jgi:DNA (cytosine-5)-methyltransferase 1